MARIVSIVASSAATECLSDFSGRPYLIFLLPCRNPFFGQLFEPCSFRLGIFQLGPAARDIRFSHSQLGLVFGDRGLRLAQRLTKRLSIDFEKQIALVHVSAFREFNGRECSGNLSFDFDCGIRFNSSDGLYLNRHRFFSYLRNSDRDGRKRRTGRLCLW